MSLLLSWIKKQIGYFFNSIPEIFKAIVLSVLVISGLASAILLRYLNQSGTIIISVAISVELIAIVAIYFIFKTYLKSEEEIKVQGEKTKKK